MLCKIDELRPARAQPRRRMDEKGIAALADSIRAAGVLQPLVVRRADGGYEIIAGERRWRAARAAGLAAVPVVVKEAADAEALTFALEENLQREDLNPIEEAEALRRLVEEHGRTQEQLAARLGRDRSSLSNSLRLLKLPPEVQDLCAAGALSAGHARALLMLGSPADQVTRARDVVSRGLSVRATEELCRAPRRAERAPAPKSRAVSAGVRALEERLQRALGTKVRLRARGKGGQIVIDFYSLAELERLMAELTRR